MYLSHHSTTTGKRWALDGNYLSQDFNLRLLLDVTAEQTKDLLLASQTEQPASGELLPPIESDQEVWASGVTYLQSREARMRESDSKDIYQKVYEAERPEIFFKSIGWRATGHEQPIRVRKDSHWNVPEPELVLVINRFCEIIGYCAGNDVSSRDIEGENPLYLPQAKVYNGSCSVGPGIQLSPPVAMAALPITLSIERADKTVFQGETSVAQMKRSLQELSDCLYQELDFPAGAFLMTGTCLVPADNFNLSPGDGVRIVVGELTLENQVIC